MARQRYGFLADGLNLGKDLAHAVARRGVAATIAIDLPRHRQ
jgi:hypothetical protein